MHFVSIKWLQSIKSIDKWEYRRRFLKNYINFTLFGFKRSAVPLAYRKRRLNLSDLSD